MASQNIQNIQGRALPNSPFTQGGTIKVDPNKSMFQPGWISKTPQTTDLGQGVPMAQAATAEISKNAPQGTYTAAPKSTSPQDAAAYMTQMAKSIGIKGPADTRDATRTAAFQGLDKAAYMDSIRGANQLSAQGQERGSRSQALSALRGSELAGNKAQTEAQIQGQYAQQLAGYQQAMLGGAQRQGEFSTTMGAQEAGRATQASENNARMAQAQQQMRSATQMQAAGMISDEEYRRKMQEYEAALNQIQQQNTADMLAEQSSQAKKDRWTGIGTQLISSTGDVVSSALGGK